MSGFGMCCGCGGVTIICEGNSYRRPSRVFVTVSGWACTDDATYGRFAPLENKTYALDWFQNTSDCEWFYRLNGMTDCEILDAHGISPSAFCCASLSDNGGSTTAGAAIDATVRRYQYIGQVVTSVDGGGGGCTATQTVDRYLALQIYVIANYGPGVFRAIMNLVWVDIISTTGLFNGVDCTGTSLIANVGAGIQYKPVGGWVSPGPCDQSLNGADASCTGTAPDSVVWGPTNIYPYADSEAVTCISGCGPITFAFTA